MRYKLDASVERVPPLDETDGQPCGDDVTDQLVLVKKLRANLGFSPNVDRNIIMIESYLAGKSYADIARANGVSAARVRQIIQLADRRVGGGITKGVVCGDGNGAPVNPMMEEYPYVWDLAGELGLTRRAAFEFYEALHEAGSLDLLVASLKQSGGLQGSRKIAREVLLREHKNHLVLDERQLTKREFDELVYRASEFVICLKEAGFQILAPDDQADPTTRLMSLVELISQRKSGTGGRPDWLTDGVVQRAADALGASLTAS